MLRRVVFASIALAAPLFGACSSSLDPIDAGSDFDAETDASIPPAPDAGTPRDGGPIILGDAGACDTWTIDEGDPITGLEAGAWTWVGFDGAHCANGSSTGIGINLSPTGEQRVVIYLEGGGACFDAITCAGVANPDGFGASRFGAVSGDLNGYGLFRRTDTDNPFRDWTFVYVPYCTGDVHAGTNVAGYEGREQVGYTNVSLYLERLVPTFTDAEMVFLVGSSAGGLGAFANYDQVQHAFGCTPVHMIDDSGPVMDDTFLRPCLQEKTRELWGLPVPADCPQCTVEGGGDGLVAMWTYLAQKYPERRFAQLSYTGDGTMRNFYGIGLSPRCNFPSTMSVEMFSEGLVDLRDRVMAPLPNTHAFYADADSHTFLPQDLGRPTVGGVSVGAWIGLMIDGDPAWSNAGP